jgi:hypothetical protein
MRHPSLVLLMIGIGLGLAACDKQEIDTPTPPSMHDLLAVYEAPSAPFTQETVQSVLARQQAIVAQIEDLDGLAPILDLVFSIGGSGETEGESGALSPYDDLQTFEGGLAVGGQPVEGDGYLILRRVCPGWKGDGAVDEANGTLSLTAVFSDEGFEAVVWGEADQCRHAFEGRELLLDGAVKIHTGGLLQGTDTDVRLLIAFEGSAQIDGEAFDADLSLRAHLTATRLDVNLESDGGNVLFYVNTETGEAGFEAANGIWVCDFEGGQCTHDGQSISLW